MPTSPSSGQETAEADSLYASFSFFLVHAFIDFIFATSAVLSNALLLITIYRDSRQQKQLWRTPVTVLVINLSVCDLFSGIVPGYGSLYYDINVLLTQTNEKLRKAKFTIIICAILTNVVGSCTIVAMSFDRLIAVTSPLEYKTRVTKAKLKIFITVVWIYALLFVSLSRTGVPQEIFILLYCHLHMSLPLIILAVVFWKTYRALRLHNNQIGTLAIDSEIINAAHRKRERKVLSAILFVLCLFYASFTPQFIALNLSFFSPWLRGKKAFKAFLYTSNKVLFVNSSVNPFIYAWRLPKYRRAFKAVFQRNNLVNHLHINMAANQTNTAELPVTLSGNATEDTVKYSGTGLP